MRSSLWTGAIPYYREHSLNVLAGKIVIPNARYRNDIGQWLVQEDSRSYKRVGITRF